jgi:hypothetical protein
VKGKAFNGYDPSLFKDASDVDLKVSLAHHQTKLFDAISFSFLLFSWRYNPLWLYFPQTSSGL